MLGFPSISGYPTSKGKTPFTDNGTQRERRASTQPTVDIFSLKAITGMVLLNRAKLSILLKQ